MYLSLTLSNVNIIDIQYKAKCTACKHMSICGSSPNWCHKVGCRIFVSLNTVALIFSSPEPRGSRIFQHDNARMQKASSMKTWIAKVGLEEHKGTKLWHELGSLAVHQASSPDTSV